VLTFPGAEPDRGELRPIPRADGEGDPIRYVTTYGFRLPAGASREEVAPFYRHRLSKRWALVEENVAGRGERVVNFRRDDTSLSVNLESRDVLELSSDYDSFGKLSRQE
jgi:hypothetical protein